MKSEDDLASWLKSKSNRNMPRIRIRHVGTLVGAVGILLSVVTIASHRAHTQAVIHRTESNDQWAFYQAKKIRGARERRGMAVLQSGPAADSDKAVAAGRKLEAARDKYAGDAKDIMKEAQAKDSRASSRSAGHCVSTSVKGCWNSGWCCARCSSWRATASFRYSAFSPAPPAPRWASWVFCFERPSRASPAGHRRRFSLALLAAVARRRSLSRPRRRESKRVRPICWRSGRCMAIG